MSRFTFFAVSAAVVVGCLAIEASAVPLYDIKPLGSTGTPDVYVKGINDHGKVVGYSVDAAGLSHAILWENGEAGELAYNAGALKQSEAYRINNNGEIAGKARGDNGNFQAAYWSPTGDITNIGTLGGPNSFANDINDAGVVAGSSAAAVGSHAFTWTSRDGFVDYGNNNPNSALGQAGWNGINENGLMVGTSYSIFSPFKASLGRVGDREPTQISPPGQFSTGMAMAVNDSDVIVGYQNGGAGAPQAAIFDGRGGYTPLGALGLTDSWALDINNAGTIVGTAFGDDGTGAQLSKSFVYTDGQMYDLMDQLIDSAGWSVLFEAAAINSDGVIVGSGIYNDEIRGFILTPAAVPEPGTASLIAAGAMQLARRRRRR